MLKVGIPHSLFYFYYYPLWKTFFEELGAQVIKSHPTSRLTVDQGWGWRLMKPACPSKYILVMLKSWRKRGLIIYLCPG